MTRKTPSPAERLPSRYLAPACGLGAFLLLWQAGSLAYGSFILPTPIETLRALAELFTDGRALPAIWTTARRALAGFVLAGLFGSALGYAAGLRPFLERAVRPIVSFFLGAPPIAWIVLALLWFGSGTGAAVFTVAAATFPVVYAGALQGVRTLDRDLDDMARSYRAPALAVFFDVRLPHVVSYLYPEWVTALGLSFKAAVMAELLGATDGVGAGLAMARVNLETAEAMAWIIAVAVLLVFTHRALLEPVRARVAPRRKSGDGVP